MGGGYPSRRQPPPSEDGPFAFDGVFALWLPFTVFFAWMVVMSAAVFKAIKAEELRQLAEVSAEEATDRGVPVAGT